MKRSLASRFFAALPLALVLSAVAAGAAGAAQLPSGFREDRFLADLKEPTSVAFSPASGDERIFVAEKSGLIVAYDDLQDDQKTVVANLRKQVYDTGDRGLLSMAIDPEFPAQPYLYALYTFDHVIGVDDPEEFPHWGEGPDYVGDPCEVPPDSTADACAVSGRLVRLTVSEGGAGSSVVKSGGQPLEHVLIGADWCQQFSSHSVGDLQFDPDGNLYVSGGDGASFNVPDYGELGFPGAENVCADPPGGIGDLISPPSAEGGALRSQDLRTPGTLSDPTGLGGTVIRIDPDSGEGVPGNPLYASLDANERRIVAYGFRNPFRIALDPDHGDLYVSNVGWGSYEELDRVSMLPDGPPQNSGWPCYEGPGPNPSYQDLGLDICADLYAEAGATVEPFLFYKHLTHLLPDDGCTPNFGSAAAGVFVYPGGNFPAAYDGTLFFADTVRSCIWTMKPGEDGRPDASTIAPFLTDGGLYPGADFLVDEDGDFYYLKFYGEEDEGSLRRITYDPDSPRARLSADRTFGEEAPLAVELDASGSTDPNGKSLTYRWDLDGDGTFETIGGAQRSALIDEGDEEEGNPEERNVEVAVRVSNGTTTDVARLTVYPGNTPPEPVVETASDDWAVGETIGFSGYATDAEDEGIDESGLFWRTELYHCPDDCHAHPLRNFPGVSEGSFSAPDHEYPSYLKLIFTATDSRGLSSSEVEAANPLSVEMKVESYPAGISIGAGSTTKAAPYAHQALEKSKVTLTAPPTAVIDGVSTPFLRWSNGGSRVQTVTADANATYTAYYREPGKEPEPKPDPPVTEPPAGEPPASERPPATEPAPRPRSKLRAKPAPRTTATTARFVFGSQPAGASFRCKLDAKPYAPCRSPRVYRKLKPGRHVLRVQAVAADGKAEAKPSVYRWQIVKKPPRKRGG